MSSTCFETFVFILRGTVYMKHVMFYMLKYNKRRFNVSMYKVLDYFCIA